MIKVIQENDKYKVIMSSLDREQIAGDLVALFESVLTQGISRELLHKLVDGAVSRNSEDIERVMINRYQEGEDE